MPYGDGRHAPIAAEDQAQFIAAVLTNPSGHVGKIYPLFGPVEMNHEQVASVLTEVLDREIVYAPSTIEEYRKHLKTYNLPEFLIQHFEEVAIDYQNGVFAGADAVIGQITGQPPQTVQPFVQANRKALEA